MRRVGLLLSAAASRSDVWGSGKIAVILERSERLEKDHRRALAAHSNAQVAAQRQRESERRAKAAAEERERARRERGREAEAEAEREEAVVRFSPLDLTSFEGPLLSSRPHLQVPIIKRHPGALGGALQIPRPSSTLLSVSGAGAGGEEASG